MHLYQNVEQFSALNNTDTPYEVELPSIFAFKAVDPPSHPYLSACWTMQALQTIRKARLPELATSAANPKC
jgi:hypothetical protein